MISCLRSSHPQTLLVSDGLLIQDVAKIGRAVEVVKNFLNKEQANMWRDYHVVDSIEQALEILKDNGPSARIIAGGTDMIIELDRKMRPDVNTLIDITRVPGLDEISHDSSGIIRLGPLVTHNQCAASDVLRDYALPLAQACWEVGAPQIRNRSTIAGNLITASPANDTITPLVALDGVVTLSSTTGQRKVNLSDFYLGVRKTVMRSDEIMTAIEFPSLLSDEIGIFQKLGLRRAQANFSGKCLCNFAVRSE
ncbi:MAG: hypothetical protein CM1200mP6_08200 [Anaerolineaceae bacterium]|nr:MAG: hypothetical protein CM1200mP6_08200 [Anaerolineaceae bacterium]